MWGRWRRRSRRGHSGDDTGTPVQRTFAEYFAAWGLFLPDEAAAQRAAGYLLGKGWSVRWRWIDDGVGPVEGDPGGTVGAGLSGTVGAGLSGTVGAGLGGTVEFLASHRMTNERWHRIAPDGTLSAIDVPFEAMIFPADADDERRAAIEREYREAWSAHGRAVARAGMDPIQGRDPVPPELAGPDLMTWKLDGGEWQSAPLRSTA